MTPPDPKKRVLRGYPVKRDFLPFPGSGSVPNPGLGRVSLPPSLDPGLGGFTPLGNRPLGVGSRTGSLAPGCHPGVPGTGPGTGVPDRGPEPGFGDPGMAIPGSPGTRVPGTGPGPRPGGPPTPPFGGCQNTPPNTLSLRGPKPPFSPPPGRVRKHPYPGTRDPRYPIHTLTPPGS